MIPRSFLQAGTVVLFGNGIAALVGIAALRLYTELAPAEVFGSANLLLGVLGLGSSVFVMPIVNTQIRYQTEAAKEGYGDRFPVKLCEPSLPPLCCLEVPSFRKGIK